MPQPRVPLAQGFLQALPGLQKPWFHVEHTPVEKLPTNLGRAFQQAEAVGIDELNRQGLGQLRRTTGILPVDTNLELTLTLTRYAEIAQPTIFLAHLTEHGTANLLVLDNRLQPGAAKGTGQPEQMHSLKQTGLAAAIGAKEDIDAGGGGDRHRVQIAHRGDGNTGEGHSAGIRGASA